MSSLPRSNVLLDLFRYLKYSFREWRDSRPKTTVTEVCPKDGVPYTLIQKKTKTSKIPGFFLFWTLFEVSMVLMEMYFLMSGSGYTTLHLCGFGFHLIALFCAGIGFINALEQFPEWEIKIPAFFKDMGMVLGVIGLVCLFPALFLGWGWIIIKILGLFGVEIQSSLWNCFLIGLAWSAIENLFFRRKVAKSA